MSLTPFYTIAHLTFLEAIRSRLLLLMAICWIILSAIVFFISDIALTETQSLQIATSSALIRIIAFFTVSLFVINNITREYNDHFIDLLVAQAVPRSFIYLGKAAGHCTTALFIAVILTPFLFFIAPAGQVFVWGATLIFELWIIVIVAQFFASTLQNLPLSFTLTCIFYVLARLISWLQIMAESKLAEYAGVADTAIKFFLQALSIVIPDLSEFSATQWLLNERIAFDQIFAIFVQTILAILLFLAAGLFDFYRRNL
ncbi:MAG: hypothetical protein BMS9Abin15_0983 [Gammaproteobacteria bacterium]|nr:MAG: hypothetical protein BMS9Abin15_0983 [Gammaproteobacteria bacterium]